MFNLFVDSDKNNWDGNPTWLPIDRFLIYTDSELKSDIDLSKSETLKKLKSLPCVFSYELHCLLVPAHLSVSTAYAKVCWNHLSTS